MPPSPVRPQTSGGMTSGSTGKFGREGAVRMSPLVHLDWVLLATMRENKKGNAPFTRPPANKRRDDFGQYGEVRARRRCSNVSASSSGLGLACNHAGKQKGECPLHPSARKQAAG